MALFGNKKIKEDKEVVKKGAKKAKEVKTTTATTTTSSMKDLYSEKDEKREKGKAKNVSKRVGSKTLAARTLLKPLITEKATNLVEQGKYVFVVSLNANKIEIAKAVHDVYGVEVEAVNVIKMEGKRVSRGKIKGKRVDFKKAIVSLKKGESIQLYEGV